jgi:hypothetical protein
VRRSSRRDPKLSPQVEVKRSDFMPEMLDLNAITAAMTNGGRGVINERHARMTDARFASSTTASSAGPARASF